MNYLFEHRTYAFPLKNILRTSHGPWLERRGAIVRVRSEAGNVGWGEVAPISFFSTETLDEAIAALVSLNGTLDEGRIDALPQGLRCTRGALRAALADARAIRTAPLESERAEQHLQVAGLLPAGKAALDILPQRIELGFRVFKWKVGVQPPREELPLLDDVLAGLPAGGKLRLDANGGWDRRQAELWLERCAERPIEFVEQPVACGCPRGDDVMLGLSADYPTPLALDESVAADADVLRWLDLGWRGVFVLKTGLLDDPLPILDRLSEAKARVVFSSSLQTLVGTRLELRHAFRWRGEQQAVGFGVWPLFSDGRLDGGYPSPWLHAGDLESWKPEVVWNAST